MKETNLPQWLKQADPLIVNWMHRYGTLLMRISLGIVFVWFGGLKTIGISPATELVSMTVSNWVDPAWFVPFLGYWEVLIGICFLYRPWVRVGIVLMALQMPGTMMPLFLLPDVTFTAFPYGLTLAGQYIVKNLVLISGAILVGGTLLLPKDSDRKL